MSEDKNRPEEDSRESPVDSSQDGVEDTSAPDSSLIDGDSSAGDAPAQDTEQTQTADSEEPSEENESQDSGPAMDAEIIGDFAPHPLLPATETLPDYLPILPIAERPFFPGITLPIQISNNDFLPIIEYALKQSNRFFGAVLVSDLNEDAPVKSEYYDVGTAIKILRADQAEDSLQLLVQTVRRFSRKKVIQGPDQGTPVWQVEYHEDPARTNQELKAYTLALITSVRDLLRLNPLFQEQLKMLLSSLSYDKPGLIMDLISSMMTSDGDKLQEILETLSLIPRARKLLRLLQEEIQLFELQQKIKQSIEEKISQQQKEFFLREQLKAIKKELGLEKDDKEAEIEKFEQRLEKLTLSEEARKVIEDNLEKLRLIEPASPEYNVTHTYLDWLTLLPWGFYTEDSFDIEKARAALDRDHYGLDDVKERILEYISTGKISGSILCFVGPPGVGKTSIGRSVAEALNRKFFRFSLGGMRDEAEIKGHRRTYIGAMPGKFIQSLKTTESANPVIMLDEIDKIGSSFQGDPASALLEVLDPEQNHAFLDHYLDVRFDLSRVLFICTANTLDTVPAPLLDRMEVIKLPGYILEEKAEIAKRYLIPNALKDHGLEPQDLDMPVEVLDFLIDQYSREAGVRNLENRIKKIMRKITMAHATGNTDVTHIKKENLTDFLGPPLHTEEPLYKNPPAGVVTGLAWTSMGGATLSIECSAMLLGRNGGGYKLTGQLGDVMKESAEIAYSYVQSQIQRFGIDANFFESNKLHLHVPAGATPKDGPSAGITMALAIYSLAKKQPVPALFAMTGELTLTGRVLPVGGIKEKIIAAKRMGIRRIILPRENLRDFKELPDYLRAGLKCFFVRAFDDVIKSIYDPKPEEE
ncbi:MAG: endopeptidase La [Leptospiraceae bacterium]|nr:endopeptidase La [Leptospiraceae bacterium]